MAIKRKPSKIKKILDKRGYPKGKVPPGKEAHHPKPKAEGGKDIPSNILVVSKSKHKRIHNNNRKAGRV